MKQSNGIRYKQVIDLGFKRKDLGGDQVFHDQYGYDWFIASKTLVKEQGCKIIANWHPETQEIEVLYLNKKRDVVSRQRFSGQHGLARYRAIQLFFKPKPSPQELTSLQSTLNRLKTVLENQKIPTAAFPIGGTSLVAEHKQDKIASRIKLPRVGEIDAHEDIHVSALMEVTETHASYIPVFDPETGLFQHKLPIKNKQQ